MGQRVIVPGWLLASLVVVIAANVVAGTATGVTIDLMQGASEFARTVRARDLAVLPIWRAVAYPVLITISLTYLWPVVRHFRCADATPASDRARSRAVNAPFVLATLGFVGWVSSALVFPALTLVWFGHWSTDLMSQHVLSPLVNGFLAATTSYLAIDWLFRTRVIPYVVPADGTAALAGVAALGVGARLVVFLLAVAFVPLFTMLGLVRAAAARLDAGRAVAEVVPQLVRASEGTFGLYVVLGLVLTLLLARTFTRPLAEVTAALRRVRAGTLDQPVRISSADEVGVLEEGVNALAATLRENERILQTFGRVVEPAVRDRLLAGTLRGEGEIRTASVLFCDLRGFTALAERSAPRELVETVNQFFSVMTEWARACGGFVDKFIGDGMLVVFGLFDDRHEGTRDGAAAALRCALGMRERLTTLNSTRTGCGRMPLAMKIGVHTGTVVAGTIGAVDRHEYTVIGDTVNVAARLEEQCAAGEVVVSAVAAEHARAAGVALPAAAHDAIVVRGRDEPVRILRCR